MTFLMPPFQVQDEYIHWRVALNRAARLLIQPPIESSPEACLEVPFNWRHVAFLRQRVRIGTYAELEQTPSTCRNYWVPYGTALTYPGVLAAKLLSLFGTLDNTGWGGMLTFLVARVFQGCLVCLVIFRLVHHSVRTKVELKPGLLAILAFSISPMFVKQSFGISADGVTLAFCFCLLTWVYFWRELSRIDFALFIFCGFAAFTTKPMIACLGLGAIVFCHFFYHGEVSSRSSRLRLHSLLVLTLIGILFTLWDLSYLDVPFKEDEYLLIGYPKGVSPRAQLSWMADNKMKAIVTIVDGFVYMLKGQYAGALDFGYPKLLELATPFTTLCWSFLLCSMVLLDLFLCICLYSRGGQTSEPSSKIKVLFAPSMLLLGALSFGLATSFAQFLRNTAVGGAEVGDLQLRYYFAGTLFLIASIQLIIFSGLKSVASLVGGISALPSKSKYGEACVTVFFMLCASATAGALMLYSVSIALDILRRYW
jgi:hypothetical protein